MMVCAFCFVSCNCQCGCRKLQSRIVGDVEAPIVMQPRGLTSGNIAISDGEEAGYLRAACFVLFEPAVFQPFF